MHNTDSITGTYFRPRGGTRAAVLLGQPRGLKAAWQTPGALAGLTTANPAAAGTATTTTNGVLGGGGFVNAVRRATQQAQILQKQQSSSIQLSRTWGAPNGGTTATFPISPGRIRFLTWTNEINSIY